MNQADVYPLLDEIHDEQKATAQAIRSMEIALGRENNDSKHSLMEAKLAQGHTILREWDWLVNSNPETSWDNYPIARVAANRIGAMLVGNAYERIRNIEGLWSQHLYHREEMQFLRWVRHGVFHGNRFVFDSYDGKTAKWREVELTPEMEDEMVFCEIQGERLHPSLDSYPPNNVTAIPEVEEGLLDVGDALALVETAQEVITEELD